MFFQIQYIGVVGLIVSELITIFYSVMLVWADGRWYCIWKNVVFSNNNSSDELSQLNTNICKYQRQIVVNANQPIVLYCRHGPPLWNIVLILLFTISNFSKCRDSLKYSLRTRILPLVRIVPICSIPNSFFSWSPQ